MLDINLIREQPDTVRTALKNRQFDTAAVDSILQLDEKRRSLLTQVEAMKAERNAVSKEIGQMKDAGARQSRIDVMRVLGDRIGGLDKELAELDSQLKALTATLPNIPDARTPIGKDDSENVVLRTMGEPQRARLFPQSRIGILAPPSASSISNAAPRSPARASTS